MHTIIKHIIIIKKKGSSWKTLKQEEEKINEVGIPHIYAPRHEYIILWTNLPSAVETRLKKHPKAFVNVRSIIVRVLQRWPQRQNAPARPLPLLRLWSWNGCRSFYGLYVVEQTCVSKTRRPHNSTPFLAHWSNGVSWRGRKKIRV